MPERDHSEQTKGPLGRAAARVSRRAFMLGGSAALGAGLALGLYLQRRSQAEARVAKPVGAGRQGGFAPHALVHIADDGQVTLLSTQPEIGQGVKTALPMILAEELAVAWHSVKVVQGDFDPALGRQTVGGSRSVPDHFQALLRLGATARTMLVAAAAQQWQVDATQCEAQEGVVHHRASGRQLAYGALAALAARLPVPAPDSVRLSAPSGHRLLGQRIGGVDNQAIVTGQPLFGLDTQLPGMLHAVYIKAPVFGARVRSANLAAVLALPGVRHAWVLEGSSNLRGLMPGVAIVADSTWAALSARRQLQVVWDDPPDAAQLHESWAGHQARAQALSRQPGQRVVRREGEPEAALAAAAHRVEAAYQYPFIAHTCMEPPNCTAWWHEGRMSLWAATQNPQAGVNMVADLLGLQAGQISLHLCRSGGGFGRRLSVDYIAEAAAIAHRVPAPVKLMWTREDDLQHDHYRAGGFHFLQGGVDAQGRLSAWLNHFVTFGNPVRRGGMQALQLGNGAGLSGDEFPARWVPHVQIAQSVMATGLPMGPWRAPQANVQAWVHQSFLNELAHAAGRDPLAFLLQTLGDRDRVPGECDRGHSYNVARAKGVLHHVAQQAGWGQGHWPRGRGQGIAFHFSAGGYVAQVAEVSVSPAGVLTVDRVVVAVDVGAHLINLSGAEAQVQGAVIDALSALMYQELAIEQGRVVQANFHDYPTLRLPQVPTEVVVHFVRSPYPVSGLGEPAFPPLAPAVCNAIFAATGKRVRQLPLARTDLSW